MKRKIVKAPDVPSPQHMQQDLTAVQEQDFSGAPAGPSLFSGRLDTEEPVIPKPTITPRLNKTLKKTIPKPITTISKPPPSTVLPPPPAEDIYNMPEEVLKPRILKKSLKGINPELVSLQSKVDSTMRETPYKDDGRKPYVPEYSKAFRKFIRNEFSTYQLPVPLKHEINPDACAAAAKSDVQTYKYQAFVRDYMRQAAPYRGVLVYHGLGSGKTCTSIAAAEALYSQSNKKIIVMTPKALKENFLDQLTFCGFRHYRLKNVWKSFPIDSDTTRLFAQSYIGIPKWYMEQILKAPTERRLVWMPDLNEPESASNFESLEPWQQSSIRNQIYAVLGNKIKFIGYTGIKSMDLKNIAIKDPTYFDDSVIIIDEVHNLTRLMAGKLDKYLRHPMSSDPFVDDTDYEVSRGARKDTGVAYERKMDMYEPVGVDRWVPKKQSPDQKYQRAYLFYRLITGAKNSKIIALSGTPIVNKPVELGILTNMLHGYYNTFKSKIILPRRDDMLLEKIKVILRSNKRVGFYNLIIEGGNYYVFCSILEDGYVNIYKKGTDELAGVMYAEDDVKPATIQELFIDIKNSLEAEGIKLEESRYRAYPVLPPIEDHFNQLFINSGSLEVKNPITFANRISGLISYYRGSRDELMPRVVRDEVIQCPMSSLQLAGYEASRTMEIESDKKKKKSKKPSGSLEEGYLLDSKESSSYRFRSRACCNLVFPTDISRPFPNNTRDLAKAIQEGDMLITDDLDLGENYKEVAEAESDIREAEIEDKDEEDIAAEKEADEDMTSIAEEEGKKQKMPRIVDYSERITQALNALYARKSKIFGMDSNLPEDRRLSTYSCKFSEILKRINESPGTSLVYSAFKTIEGIGVFGYALEANNFVRIQLAGDEFDRTLDETTIKSLKENPTQPRYIIYSGSESIRDRQIYINIFNNRISKLPPKIASILKETKYGDKSLVETDNQKGEICKVFMITGAGAEGLSLRNVRTVHIMEPYWNKVRTDQVKGRAIRICSHQDLPFEERTVEIFTYVATFPKGVPINDTIVESDFGPNGVETSDQYILGIGNKKEIMSKEFLKLSKAGAVDCQLNKAENEKDFQCFVYEGPVSQFLYNPNLKVDISETDQDVKLMTTKEATYETRIIRRAGVRYLAVQDKSTGKILVYLKSNPDSDDILQTNIDNGKPVFELITDPTTGKMRFGEVS